MKLLTEQESKEHYYATLTGGLVGGIGGLAVGTLGVYAASVRYPAFRQLTLPLRAFLVTSSGTFASIVTADSYSRAYERKREPDYDYQDEQQQLQQQIDAQKSGRQKTMDWLSENRYGIVFGSWVASMGTALGLVGRNPYLTGQQKLVQARVYAQGLTIAIVIISLAFETRESRKGRGWWETAKIIDPNDPEHKKVIEKKIHHEAFAGEDQWRDMVEAEEQRIQDREEKHKKHVKDAEKKGKDTKHTKVDNSGDGNGNDGKKDSKSESKDSKSESKDSKSESKDSKSESKDSKSESKDSGNGGKEKTGQKSDSKDGKAEKSSS